MAFKPYRPKPPGASSGSRPGGGRPYNRGPRPPEHNINNFIRANEVRLIGDNLDEISAAAGQPVETGVFSTSKLQKWAEELSLDLVEITPNAVPPVVRIVDYNKFLYQKKKREKELKANAVKVELKEIRFGPETGEHDFEFKLRHAKSFLSEGNKVKAYVQFRGRAIVFKERGELLLLRFMKELEEHGSADQLPRLEGKRMHVILSPKKAPQKQKSQKEAPSPEKLAAAAKKKEASALAKLDGVAPAKKEAADVKTDGVAPAKTEVAAVKTDSVAPVETETPTPTKTETPTPTKIETPVAIETETPTPVITEAKGEPTPKVD